MFKVILLFSHVDVDITVPGFGNTVDSYLQVSGTLTRTADDSVVVSVKSLSSNGLVFLMLQNPNGVGDFVSLTLVNDKPVYKFDVGSGSVTIASPQTIPRGVFTSIELR